MREYAELINLALAAVLLIGVAVFARSCGKDVGLREGSKERVSLEKALGKANLDISSCVSRVGLANNIADQAATESLRLEKLARDAADRADREAEASQRRIADLSRQLQAARRNPDAAAQLDIELHPSIPLR